MVTNLFYDVSKLLYALNMVGTITTSVDGTEEIHNKIRGKDCFSTTISNIKTLIKSSANVKVIVTLQDLNYKCLDEVIAVLTSLGVSDIMLAHVSPMGMAIENSSLVQFSVSSEELKEKIFHLDDKYNINISTSMCGFLNNNHFECQAGKNIYYLSSKLILHPCHLRRNYGVSIFSPACFEEISEYCKK